MVLTATFVFLVYYWRSHPEITAQLKAVSPWAVAAIIGLYLTMTLVLVGVYDTILRMCGKPIGLREHTLLTMYSSIINFFGPLQSGPGVRTVYLKQRHGVSIKAYLAGTLVYYALFGVINLSFVAMAFLSERDILPASASLFLLTAAIALAFALLPRIAPRLQPLLPARVRGVRLDLNRRLVLRLALFTLLQALLAVAIYRVGLAALDIPVSFGQALAYAGAGSLALFVSLTPAALGFRESFQYFTQGIHGIDGQAIVTANLLDRSAYVAVLGALFVFIVLFHAKSRIEAGLQKGDTGND